MGGTFGYNRKTGQYGTEQADGSMAVVPAESVPAEERARLTAKAAAATGPTMVPKSRTTGAHFGPFGVSATSVNPAAAPEPVQIRVQEISSEIVLKQADDAIKFYDQHILPREKEFTGTLGTTRSSAMRGFMQWPEYRYSRYTEPLGGKGDPEVKEFYSKTGPIIAQQMRALIGGRIGAQLVAGPIAPHLPNAAYDSLPTMRQKLVALKANVPIILQTIKQMRGRGMNDDQIFGEIARLPWNEGKASPTTGATKEYTKPDGTKGRAVFVP